MPSDVLGPPSHCPDDPEIYNDAVLAALQVVRQCVIEDIRAEVRSEDIANEIVVPFFERHGSAGIYALVHFLRRHMVAYMTVVLLERLGHLPSEDEFFAELDLMKTTALGTGVAFSSTRSSSSTKTRKVPDAPK
jgi:hypothetical protein